MRVLLILLVPDGRQKGVLGFETMGRKSWGIATWLSLNIDQPMNLKRRSLKRLQIARALSKRQQSPVDHCHQLTLVQALNSAAHEVLSKAVLLVKENDEDMLPGT